MRVSYLKTFVMIVNYEDATDIQGVEAGVSVEVGMLLNTLQCTRQSSTTKNYLAQNVDSANVEKPLTRDSGEKQNFGRHSVFYIWCQITDNDG